MLPKLCGFEICKEVRRDSDIPIIFMTARAAQSDMLKGYGLGCDDYVVKPFLLPVLFEKVNALIKRSKGLVRLPQFYAGSLTLNPNNGKVSSQGVEVTLTSKEFSILKILFDTDNELRALFLTDREYDPDTDSRLYTRVTSLYMWRRARKRNLPEYGIALKGLTGEERKAEWQKIHDIWRNL